MIERIDREPQPRTQPLFARASERRGFFIAFHFRDAPDRAWRAGRGAKV